MNETELERLVIRLVGDGSSYQRMLEQAQQSTNTAAKSIQASAQKIESFKSGLDSFGRTFLGVLSSLGLVTSLRGAFEMFDAYDRSLRRLKTTIEVTGGEVESTIKDYEAFGNVLFKTYNISESSTRAMFEQVETMGHHGEVAKVIIKNAVAMAGAKGGEAQAYLRASMALAEGNLQAVKYSLRLRGVKDESEILTKVQRLMATGLENARKDAEDTTGKLERLGITLKKVSIEIGRMVEGFISPLVEIAQKWADRFSNLNATVQRVIITIAGMFLLMNSFGRMKDTFSMILGLFSPWSIVLISVVAALAYVIENTVGLEKAWEGVKGVFTNVWSYIQSRALAFVEWFSPIMDTIAAASSAAWEAISAGASSVWTFISEGYVELSNWLSETWNSMSVSSGVLWDGIRDSIQELFISAEFTFKNFGAVWEHITTGLALDFVSFSNTVEHFFITVIPATLDWFSTEWVAVFKDAYNYSTTVISNLAVNIWKIFSNIPELIAGTVKFEDLWTPLSEGFIRESKKLVIPERQLGEIENQLKTEYDRQSETLKGSFEAFRATRLAELAKDKIIPEPIVSQAKKEALDVGTGIGKSVNKGFRSEKFEAVLSSSAEALTRIADFQSRLAEGREAKGTSTFKESPKLEVASATSAEGKDRAVTNNLLQQIRDTLVVDAKKPGMNVKVAGLTN